MVKLSSLERMKHGVSDTRFNKSVQRRMENGESFEVATLETAKGIEENVSDGTTYADLINDET